MGNVNEERMKKFRDMGIPMPMAPVDPATVQGPVKNTDFAKKLMEIKNGKKKEELNTFIEKEKIAPIFTPLEAKKKNNVQSTNKAVIAEEIKVHAASGPSFDLYEKALYGETSHVQESNNNPRGNYTSNITESVDTGSDFLANVRQRLQEKALQNNPNMGQVTINSNNTVPAGYRLVNEAELRDTITSISTNLIKKFMAEFLNSEPGLLKENDKIKKAEIIKEDIIKMEGRFFKLTPVNVKKK